MTAAAVSLSGNTGTAGTPLTAITATCNTTPSDGSGHQFEYDFLLTGAGAAALNITNSGNKATITGTPFEAGACDVTCNVKDTAGKVFAATKATITISAAS